MTPDDQRGWHDRLAAATVHFQPEPLARGVSFLQNAYMGGGWGRRRGLPQDLYASAMAVEALSMAAGSDDLDYRVSTAASAIQQRLLDERDDLPLADLLLLLLIVQVDEETAGTAAQQLMAVIRFRLERATDARGGIATATLADMLLAVRRQPPLDGAWTETWIEDLLSRQLDDGAWPAGKDGLASLSATAVAVRATRSIDDSRARDAWHRGKTYLERFVAAEGWPTTAGMGGAAATASTLRSLAEDDRADVTLLEEGVSWLCTQVRPDHGWGPPGSDVSTVESTAACVAALVSAGHQHFVPRRLADAAVADLDERVATGQDSLDELRGTVEHEVERRCGELAVERGELRSKYQQAGVDLETAQRANEELMRALRDSQRRLDHRRFQQLSEDYSYATPIRRLAGLPVLVGVGLLLTGLAAGLAIVLTSEPVGPIIIGASLVAVPLIVVLVQWMRLRGGWSTSPVTFELDPTPDAVALRLRFVEMTRHWEPAIREEITYLVLRELAELPPPEVPQYAAYRADRLGMPPAAASDFSSWARDYADLGRSERVIVADQLRRSTLP